MKKQNNFWMILAIVLIVVIIVSLTAVSLTGNIVKTRSLRMTDVELYTKGEIDSMMSGFNQKLNAATISQGVLERLNKCQRVRWEGADVPATYTCDTICSKYNKGICTIGFISDSKANPLSNAPVECDESYNSSKFYLSCMCC